MRRILYITNRGRGNAIGGREQLSSLNAQMLRQIFGVGYQSIEMDGNAGFTKLFGYIDGISDATIRDVCNCLKVSGAERVFLDGSNLGMLAKYIKELYPSVEVLTFFHNCEARFFIGALRRTKSIKAIAVLISNYLAERSAVRWSDKRICLSERDSTLLRNLYGQGATHVSAMALKDRLPLGDKMLNRMMHDPYALFVGGAFYANQAGIEWYGKNVAPRVPLRTFVVGKGMEAMKKSLERHGNITVVGEVDDLAPWYLGAQVVVAPIFDGSGMKTKVAEALMFGKRIIGTPEAFTGYEDIVDLAGVSCANADTFVHALVSEFGARVTAIDSRLRALYEARYSYEAATMRMRTVLDEDPAGARVTADSAHLIRRI